MKENLEKMGIKKKKKKIMSFISPSLVIRHKPTRIEYTVSKLIIKKGKPIIIAYRYSNNLEKRKKKQFVNIYLKDFKSYEPV